MTDLKELLDTADFLSVLKKLKIDEAERFYTDDNDSLDKIDYRRLVKILSIVYARCTRLIDAYAEGSNEPCKQIIKEANEKMHQYGPTFFKGYTSPKYTINRVLRELYTEHPISLDPEHLVLLRRITQDLYKDLLTATMDHHVIIDVHKNRARLNKL